MRFVARVIKEGHLSTEIVGSALNVSSNPCPENEAHGCNMLHGRQQLERIALMRLSHTFPSWSILVHPSP